MRQIRFMVIGAHADDCEHIGGLALKYVKTGHKVKFLTTTNGCSGHHEQMGGTMVRRRQEEARAVSAKYGVEYDILDFDDGFLTTGIQERLAVLRAIREWAPDLIVTHRPYDYHPDHRNTSMLVQDCAYLLQVPNVAPLTPVLRYMPVILHMSDHFQKPIPFSPDLVFDITSEIDDKSGMYHLYTSQMYEWLPWVGGYLDEVPKCEGARWEWLRNRRRCDVPESWQAQLAIKYGDREVQYAEALEICEYGGRLDDEKIAELFPL